MNNVTLIGRVVRAPEFASTQQGAEVCKFDICCIEEWLDRDGAKKERKDYIRCVQWGKQIELLRRNLNVGSLTLVVGSLQTRSYENKDGKKVYVTEVKATKVEVLDSEGQKALMPDAQKVSIPFSDPDIPF